MQSASLELDGIGHIISYEEYHPYGTTAFQAKNAGINAVAKRYRYTGKERDEESGLYYHGARYYIPWLCRWVSVDPINNENYNLAKGYGLEKNLERSFEELGASPYEYCYSDPINHDDPNGERPGLRTTSRAMTRYQMRQALRRRPLEINANGRLVPQRGGRPQMPKGPLYIGPAGFRPNLGGRPTGLQPGSMWRPAPSTAPRVIRQLPAYNGSDATYVAPTQVYQSPDQKFRNFAQSLSGGNSAPFVSTPAKKEYEKLRTITSDIRKLSEQEINEIAHRIATGQANTQDLLYAPFLMNGSGRGNFVGKNNAISILSEALKMQGFSSGDTIPSNFKQKWTDSLTGIQYEVRIHPANQSYATGDIYRVSRKLPGVDANGQGKGMEYLDINGLWHHESTLKEYNKDGTRNSKFNSQGAKETHIQKPNTF